jgi:hypothetical protein
MWLTLLPLLHHCSYFATRPLSLRDGVSLSIRNFFVPFRLPVQGRNGKSLSDWFDVSATMSIWPSDVQSLESNASPIFPLVWGPPCSLYFGVLACRSSNLFLLSRASSPRWVQVVSIHLTSCCGGCVSTSNVPSKSYFFPCILTCSCCSWVLFCKCLMHLSIVIFSVVTGCTASSSHVGVFILTVGLILVALRVTMSAHVVVDGTSSVLGLCFLCVQSWYWCPVSCEKVNLSVNSILLFVPHLTSDIYKLLSTVLLLWPSPHRSKTCGEKLANLTFFNPMPANSIRTWDN